METVIYLSYSMFLFSLIFAFCKKTFMPLTFCSYSLGVVVYVQLVKWLTDIMFMLSFGKVNSVQLIENASVVISSYVRLLMIALPVAVVPMTMIGWWYVKRFERLQEVNDILIFNVVIFAFSLLISYAYPLLPLDFAKTTAGFIIAKSVALLIIVVMAGLILDFVSKRLRDVKI